jgi:putative DNA-invertase from lambdoid prophage Rac
VRFNHEHFRIWTSKHIYQDRQNQKLEIERAGHRLEFWYEDQGVSGATQASQRPQFESMLNKIGDGETLIVSKLDRLGRDAQDVGATIKMLAAMKIKVVVLQLGTLDLTSPAGKLMLTMLAAVAEMERDLLIERTSRTGPGEVRGKNARQAVKNDA